MMAPRTEQLLELLTRCMTACSRCLHMGVLEDPKMKECIRLAMDCGELCGLTARYIARDSAYGNELLSLCSRVCKACEDACRMQEHVVMQECAEACHACHLACALVA
jgi:hypothetical protein